MNKLTALRTAETALEHLWNDSTGLSDHYNAVTGDVHDPGHGIVERTITTCIANAYAEHDDELDARKQVIKDLNAYILELYTVADALTDELDSEETAAEKLFTTARNHTAAAVQTPDSHTTGA